MDLLSYHIGIIIGCLLCLGIIVIAHMLDNYIRDMAIAHVSMHEEKHHGKR